MKTLKLRGAARYTITALKPPVPVERNGTVKVEDDLATQLLGQTVRDRANTAWPVWEDVTPEGKAKVARNTVKKTRRSRAKAAPVDATDAA